MLGWPVSTIGFTGTLPTELGNLDALTQLCVHRPSREQMAFVGAQ